MERRKRLATQLADAIELEANVEKREEVIVSSLKAHLYPEDLDNYNYFIQMKTKLLVDSKQINVIKSYSNIITKRTYVHISLNLQDKLKLGQEQLLALKATTL